MAICFNSFKFKLTSVHLYSCINCFEPAVTTRPLAIRTKSRLLVFFGHNVNIFRPMLYHIVLVCDISSLCKKRFVNW